jgi:glucose-1-phosphate cytidylyltransferase
LPISGGNIVKLLLSQQNNFKLIPTKSENLITKFLSNSSEEIENDKIINFKEKPKGDGAMVNGGFFVLSPKVLDLLENDRTIWEEEPLTNLADVGELMAFRHEGFWLPMDTLRDKQKLQELWESGNAPWKFWEL